MVVGTEYLHGFFNPLTRKSEDKKAYSRSKCKKELAKETYEK